MSTRTPRTPRSAAPASASVATPRSRRSAAKESQNTEMKTDKSSITQSPPRTPASRRRRSAKGEPQPEQEEQTEKVESATSSPPPSAAAPLSASKRRRSQPSSSPAPSQPSPAKAPRKEETPKSSTRKQSAASPVTAPAPASTSSLSSLLPPSLVDAFIGDVANAFEDYSASCIGNMLEVAITAPEAQEKNTQAMIVETMKSIYSTLQHQLNEALDKFELYTRRNVFQTSESVHIPMNEAQIKKFEADIEAKNNQLDHDIQAARVRLARAHAFNAELTRAGNGIAQELACFDQVKGLVMAKTQSQTTKAQEALLSQVGDLVAAGQSLAANSAALEATVAEAKGRGAIEDNVATAPEAAAVPNTGAVLGKGNTKGRLRQDQRANPISLDAALAFNEE